MLRPAAADPNCDSLPSASTLRPPSRASSGPSPSPPQLSGECDSAGSNPPRPPPCLSVDNWSQSGSGLEVAQAWIHQTSFSKFRRQNTINLKTGEVLSKTTARVASPHVQNSPDTKIDVSDLRPPKTSCDKQGHDKESDEHQRTLSPAGSGPLLLLLDLSCAPNYFRMEMPSYLHGKLAVSTYSTRIRELNKVLCENQSCLVDYTPVKRLASLFFLGIWIITASSLMILWATSAPTLFSWSLLNSLAVIFGVLVGVVAIVAVRFAFSRKAIGIS
ncbi:hypothetical protein BDR26DRAFT_240218 [Obelidium mucronatum]|nr:hypothetical protein BDR26DRAFT_240218 [Obelidium mucronatum]